MAMSCATDVAALEMLMMQRVQVIVTIRAATSRYSCGRDNDLCAIVQRFVMLMMHS